MLHELFITHCTNGTLIMNPFTILMVDVFTICGRWNGHLMNADYMADVFAIGGRWNSHCCQMQPIWQMLLPK